MYGSKDRKTAKQGKRPLKPVQPPNRGAPNIKPRASSASNNYEKEDENYDKIINLMRDFLQKQGYQRTLQVFKTERPVRKQVGKSEIEEDPAAHFVHLFDKGLRDDFFRLWNKHFGNSSDQFVRRLEFQLNIYFYVYQIHPLTRRSPSSSIDKASIEHFKRYLETKGSQLSKTNEFLSFYALPYIQKPQQHPAICHIFTKEWLQKVKSHLTDATQGLARVSNMQKKTALQEIYAEYLSGVRECRGDCQHVATLQELREQNAEILKYLENLQSHYRTMCESAKGNLLESQRKWFQFAKEILLLADRASRGQNIQHKLQKYSAFLSVDVEQLVNCTKDVSIFERNSYLTEDVSITPPDQITKLKKNQAVLCPLNTNKVLKLFEEADRQQRQIQVCLVLQALRWRFNKLGNPYARREVIMSYSAQDLCGVKQEHWGIQDKLLFRSGVRVRECFLRLMNYITSDFCGIRYLIQEPHLIQNLMKIFKTQRQDTTSRKHALGVLQKLSLLRKPQQIMISLGVLEIIIDQLSSQKQLLSESSLQYLVSLLLNLSLRKVGKQRFQKHCVGLVKILYDLLPIQNTQIRNYVNGTIYSFVCSSATFKIQAAAIGMQTRLKDLMAHCQEGLFTRQYQYIVQKLNSQEFVEEDFYSDDQNELDFDDIDDKDDYVLSDDDKSSEDLDQAQDYLRGEELLMKEFALVGPQAVTQHLATRSLLEQTSQPRNNMSINKSRRGGDVFNRPVTPSDLERSLLKFRKPQAPSEPKIP